MRNLIVGLCAVVVAAAGCAGQKHAAHESSGARSESGKRVLHAYVSRARSEAWYVAKAAPEVSKRKLVPGLKRHEVSDEGALARAVSGLAPLPGDMQLWQYAVCMVDYNACDGRCVAIGNGYHRTRDTVNNRYCAWNSQPTYCWDHFMVKCREHIYSDECMTEMPEHLLDMYDWVCLD